MDLVSGSSSDPALYLGVLVRAVIVDHQVDVQVRRHVLVDVFEKLQELLMTVPGLALINHLARGHVERREQGRRSVPDVIVCYPFDVSKSQRQ